MTTSLGLDDLDRSLLDELVRDPGVSVQCLAEVLGTSPASASRRLHRLLRRQVVRVVGRTAPGFGDRVVRMVRVQGAPATITVLAHRVSTLPSTTWGRLSRDHAELVFGSVVAPGEPDPGTERSWADVGVKVSSHELLRIWTATPTVLTAPRHLDTVDLALLDSLATNGRMSHSELGERLGVDATTAARRRRRLSEEGVLYLEADVHPAAVPGQQDHMIWLGVRPGHIARVAQHIRANPLAAFVAATSGGYQLVCTLRASTQCHILDVIDTDLADDAITSLEVVPMDQRGRISA